MPMLPTTLSATYLPSADPAHLLAVCPFWTEVCYLGFGRKRRWEIMDGGWCGYAVGGVWRHFSTLLALRMISRT